MNTDPPVFPKEYEELRFHTKRQVAEEGLEPSPENTGKTGLMQEGGAKSGALGAREALFDADLAGWLDACPVPLDDGTKASIRRTIAAANDR